VQLRAAKACDAREMARSLVLVTVLLLYTGLGLGLAFCKELLESGIGFTSDAVSVVSGQAQRGLGFWIRERITG
jgi:hypothetical protein